MDDGFQVIVDIDLSKFFDRVHHQRLLDRLGQRIADRRILKLVRRMLKAKVVMPDGTRVTTEEGTPQGGPLSPLLSNVVLDEFDRELKPTGTTLCPVRRRLCARQCVFEMRVGPSQPVCGGRLQTTLSGCGSRAPVVSVKEKARLDRVR